MLEAVHVWVTPLTATPQRLAALYATLAPDERQRADRFLAAHAREQFVIARATLRQILGRYVGAAPADLRFVTDGNGKPALSGRELFFNVSHSGGLAVYAMTRRGEVGIDVEQLRPRAALLDMADRFFAPAEAWAIRSLPPDRREEAFFHVWTRKEAFLKAMGLGLTHGLERFEVSVPPDDPARVLHIDGDPAAGARWSLAALAPAPGFVGTLAIESSVRVELREWRG